MKVCYFGTYESKYPRNRILIDGLRDSGVEVIECHIALWEQSEHKTQQFNSAIKKLNLLLNIIYSNIKLVLKYFQSESYKADIIIVGYPGQIDIFLAKIFSLLKNQYLVFNPLISMYDSIIMDRGLFEERSVIGNLLLTIEKFIFTLPNMVLFDTNEHIKYLRKMLSIPESVKMIRIFVGADEKKFSYSRYDNGSKKIEVLFIGKFTPLHGVPTILKAARLLEKDDNIHFTIIGKGQLSEKIMQLSEQLNLKNVKFIEWVPYSNLINIIANSDISLGIFDSGGKASRVIPNKVFQAICVGRMVITRRSKAIIELFEEGKNILLCEPENPTSLARAIIKVKNDPYLRVKIATSGSLLFKQKLTVKNLGAELKEVLINRV